MLPLDALHPYARNPRTHSSEQVQAIARSIREFGFTAPILINRRDEIIAGHGRLKAAALCEMHEVPCIYLDGLTAAQQRALVIADNQLAQQAGWDMNLLATEIEELAGDDGIDITLLGFSDEELALIERRGVDLADPDGRTERAVTCPKCGHEFNPREQR